MKIQDAGVVLITFLSLIYMPAIAQKGSVIKDVDVLEQQKEVYVETYPNVFTRGEIYDIREIDPKHSKIYYKKNNINYEAVVNSDRKDMLLVATCKQIPLEKLPDIVKDSFRNDHGGNTKIERTFVVTTPLSSGFYRIDYKPGKDGETSSVFYDKFGAFEPAPY